MPRKKFKKIKYGKIAIVLFLTVLIWVWADLALDDELAVSNVTMSIAKSTDRSLMVSFGDEGQSLFNKSIVAGLDVFHRKSNHKMLMSTRLIIVLFSDRSFLNRETPDFGQCHPYSGANRKDKIWRASSLQHCNPGAHQRHSGINGAFYDGS